MSLHVSHHLGERIEEQSILSSNKHDTIHGGYTFQNTGYDHDNCKQMTFLTFLVLYAL